MSHNTNEALSWLRYALNPDTKMPEVTDWNALFDFAEKHKIVGVCNPTNRPVEIDRKMLFRWVGRVQQIRNRSELMNQRVVKLDQFLKKSGFNSCVLKGQGNAEMYPDPLSRTAGDIDVWVDAEEQEIYGFVKELFPTITQTFKHIKFPVFKDVPVDVHQIPLKLYHPRHNKLLKEWINAQKKEQMEHVVRLTGTETDVCVPTSRFNAVYQLGHILIHLIDEGVGLRHLVDFFYVLKNLADISETEKDEIRATWKKLGMLRLATAIMWIEHEVLGLSENCVLVKPNRKRGELLLQDVLEGGNFGKSSKRQEYREKYGYIISKILRACHVCRLSWLFPGEAVYKLISKISTFFNDLIKERCWHNCTRTRDGESLAT